jgi:hypothetical protein
MNACGGIKIAGGAFSSRDDAWSSRSGVQAFRNQL